MISLSDVKKSLIAQLLTSYTFLVSGLIVNFFELLTLIFIWPVNKRLYRQINFYLAQGIWGILTAMGQWWSGSDFYLYCSEDTFKRIGKENAITVMNHYYDIDWLMAMIVCQRSGILGGSKVFNKTSTKYLPILGWSLWFNEMLFVNRSWESDKKSLSKSIKSILELPKELPFHISIFCEGTRFSPAKHKASMEIAKAKGLPLLKNHLLPRTRGFHLLASEVSGKVEFMYDITIGLQKKNVENPTLKHVKDGIPISFQLYIRRIPIASIPVHDEQLCANWLYQLYREKDEIFDVFLRTGSFAENEEIKKHYIEKNKYDLYITIFWHLTIALPSTYYLLSFLINGAWIAKITLIAFFAIVNFAIKYLMSSADSNKASNYGATPSKKKE